ncbi:hypothetical protein LAHI110946_05625 [Lactococcus hircilactis]|nr:hypothetical protein [Lactococcus hircilactis]
MTKELVKCEKEVALVNEKLSNERFVQNAQPEVVEKERAKLAAYQEKLNATQKRIAELSA